MLGNNKPKNTTTYYLSKIPKVTSLHPRIKDEYLQKVNSPYKRAFLESNKLSDQAKIKAIGYFDKESADLLNQSINTISKADQFYDRFLDTVKSRPKSRTIYEDYNRYSGGNKTKFKRTRKNRKNKRKYTSKNVHT